jgi:hypothetical protein
MWVGEARDTWQLEGERHGQAKSRSSVIGVEPSGDTHFSS